MPHPFFMDDNNLCHLKTLLDNNPGYFIYFTLNTYIYPN